MRTAGKEENERRKGRRGGEREGRKKRQTKKKEGKGRFYLHISKKSTTFAPDLRMYAIFN
jgi:hypothetical protein